MRTELRICLPLTKLFWDSDISLSNTPFNLFAKTLAKILAVFVLGENHFRKCFSGNEAVWLVRKILFSRNWNPLTQKNSLWPRKCFYTSIFPSKHFRKMRERERARARVRERRRSRRDRELQLQSEIASSSSSSSSSPRRDRDRRSRSCRRSRSPIAITARSSLMILCIFWVVACVFWFVFSFFFSKHQTPKNIFRKIF